MTIALAAALAWINDIDTKPVGSHLVPGASFDERRKLAALGGLTRSLISGRDTRRWPTALRDWLSVAPTCPPDVVEATRHVLESEPDAALAELYANVVTSAHRRVLGTFFTPAAEVELMIDMWASHEDKPNSVVDVGAGVGVFTASAALRWPDAAVFAVDINPVTLGLLGLRVHDRLTVVPPASQQPGVRLVCDDYTTWITNAFTTTSTPRLILGNPPYTRAQMLSTDERDRLGAAAGGLCGLRASLSTLITAISLTHLGPDDGLCLLLPAQWLESQYARELRQHIADLHRRRVELRLVDSWQFPDAQVDAVALLVGRERTSDQPMSVATWRSDTARIIDRDGARHQTWRRLFSRAPVATVRPDRNRNALSPAPSQLRDFCTVRRGVATGANDFFVLNDNDVYEYQLPRTRLLPLARRLKYFKDVVDDDAFEALDDTERRWLLNADRQHRYEGSALDDYLSMGEAEGLHERELCRRRRSDWYDLRHDIVTPDVIFGPMTRDRIRVLRNPKRCVITNNLYGWVWHAGATTDVQDAILTWLDTSEGQLSVLDAARRQGDGLYKVEPTALSQVSIPAHVAIAPNRLL